MPRWTPIQNDLPVEQKVILMQLYRSRRDGEVGMPCGTFRSETTAPPLERGYIEICLPAGQRLCVYRITNTGIILFAELCRPLIQQGQIGGATRDLVRDAERIKLEMG